MRTVIRLSVRTAYLMQRRTRGPEDHLERLRCDKRPRRTTVCTTVCVLKRGVFNTSVWSKFRVP